MKKLIIITMIMAFLAPLALGGCSSTQNTDSSSYEKKNQVTKIAGVKARAVIKNPEERSSKDIVFWR